MDPDQLEKLRRNSQLALTKDGVWTWGGRVAENTRVQALFHRGVALRADGEVTLGVGHMWTYVTPEATAFFVRAVSGLDGTAATARLLGERERTLRGGGRTVAGWGPDERLYLWLEDPAGSAPLGGPAICLRDAHQALAARILQIGETGQAGEAREGLAIVLGPLGGEFGEATDDQRIPLVMLAGIPTAAAPRPTVGGKEQSGSPEA